MDLAVHEWIGLLAYWITGRIPVPFPGPTSADFVAGASGPRNDSFQAASVANAGRFQGVPNHQVVRSLYD